MHSTRAFFHVYLPIAWDSEFGKFESFDCYIMWLFIFMHILKNIWDFLFEGKPKKLPNFLRFFKELGTCRPTAIDKNKYDFLSEIFELVLVFSWLQGTKI